MAISYDSGTNTITITGYSETTPCTFEDVYQADQTNGWGVVSKQGDTQYYFEAKLQIGGGSYETYDTYFKDTNKQVTFDSSVFGTSHFQTAIKLLNGASVTFGEVLETSTKATNNGCAIQVQASTNGLRIYIIYASQVNVQFNSYASVYSASGTYAGLINLIYGSGNMWGNTLINSAIEYGASGYDIDGYFPIGGGWIFLIPKGATINNVYGWSNSRSLYFDGDVNILFKNIHAWGKSTLTIRAYKYGRTGKYIAHVIDSEIPKWDILWTTPSYGEILRENTLNIYLSDTNGNPIEGANVTLYDKDDNLIFSDTTDSSGTLTGGDKTVLYKKYEIDADNTVADVHTWDTKITNYSPHKLIISKTGYQTYTSELTMDEKKRLVISLKNRREV